MFLPCGTCENRELDFLFIGVCMRLVYGEVVLRMEEGRKEGMDGDIRLSEDGFDSHSASSPRRRIGEAPKVTVFRDGGTRSGDRRSLGSKCMRGGMDGWEKRRS